MSGRQVGSRIVAELRGRAWLAYLAGCTVVAATYVIMAAVSPRGWAVPVTLAYDAVAVSSSLAVMAGVRHHRPDRPGPWYLVAIAVGMSAVADVIFDVLVTVLGLSALRDVPAILYLIAYPIGATGLMLVIRRRTPGRDVTALLDALTVVTGLGLLAWSFLVVAYLDHPSMSTATKLSLLGAPVLDVVLVALAVRLAGGGPRTTSFALVMTGLTALFASDTLFALGMLSAGYRNPDPRNVGWMVWFACLGAAALHPSMRTVHERALPPPTRLTRARVAMLLGIVLVTPTLLAVQATVGRPLDLPVLLVGMTVLFTLVLLRTNGVTAATTARADLQEQVLDRIVAVTEQERTRVAADLHDGPLQRLAAIYYTMERAQSRLEHGEVLGAQELLRGLETRLSGEIDAIRRLMVELRPPLLDECGLVPALTQAAADLTRRTGTTCTVDAAPALRLDPNRETVLYRVVQEALTNVVKHAQARTVRITVLVDGRTVRLGVNDDGVGFDSKPRGRLDGHHFGLALMRQRVAVAGGTFQIHARPGAGTALIVHLPLAPSTGHVHAPPATSSAAPANRVR